MGANFYWQPVKPGRGLNVGPRSSFAEALEELHGPEPWVLGERDISALQGMRAANKDFREPLDEIIEAIEKYGEIRVWREW